MCSRFSYCHGGCGYLPLIYLAERQEIKGRQSSLSLTFLYLEMAWFMCISDANDQLCKNQVLSLRLHGAKQLAHIIFFFMKKV